MNLPEITPVILTFNEEANIARCLERLAWADQVLVLDSFSTDGTAEIAASFSNVRIEKRIFDDHTSQWNHAVSLCNTPWVLSLDADYLIPVDFTAEAQNLNPGPETTAYYGRFRYCVIGKPLRASLYPPRAILFRRDACCYVEDGHTQLLSINGQCGELAGEILHDDRKSLDRWLASQLKYAELEASYLLRTPVSALNHPDRIRRWGFAAPVMVFFYTLLVRGLILDGLAGWYYVLQRTTTECIVALYVVHRRISMRSSKSGLKTPQ
ncbi:MAG: glycosyltransferase family 2 protein [Roseimicrobium sp.]